MAETSSTFAGERWRVVQRRAPGLLAAFGAAKDPRGRLVAAWRRHAAVAGKDVLELGCGTARLTAPLLRGARTALAIELQPALVARAAPVCALAGVRLLRASGTRLPLASRSLDRIVAGWVLCGLAPGSLARCLDEARRVLRGGGEFWAFEDDPDSLLTCWRGRREAQRAWLEGLAREHRLETAEVVETELAFASWRDAARILGALCGPRVRRAAAEGRLARIPDRVRLLRARARP